MDWLHLLLIIAMVITFVRLNMRHRQHERYINYLHHLINTRDEIIRKHEATLRKLFEELDKRPREGIITFDDD